MHSADTGARQGTAADHPGTSMLTCSGKCLSPDYRDVSKPEVSINHFCVEEEWREEHATPEVLIYI